MIDRLKYATFGLFLAVLFVSPLSVEAAPGGGSQSRSAFNYEDLYFDYEVWAFDTVLGGWHYWGTFDTYQEAAFYALLLSSNGFDVEIKKINVLSPYQATR